MSKQVVAKCIAPLPPLPQGSGSSLRVVDFIYDNGSVRRLWEKDDGVQVLGLTTDGMVIAITEHGYTHLVGGYVQQDENPEHAARREFLEETGHDAEKFELLAAMYQDSGGSNRIIWFYMATNCRKIHDNETDITVTLLQPTTFWKLIASYIETQPDIKRKGLMSLAATTLAFHKLGWLTVTPIHKEK